MPDACPQGAPPLDASTIAARRYYASQAGVYAQGGQRGLWRYLRSVETPAVLSMASIKPGESVLDAGCGAGHYAEALMNAGACVTGLDIEPAMLRQVSGRLRIPTIHGDVVTTHLQPVFDKVVCAGALEFVPQRAAAIANLARGLRPDGPRKVVILILSRCLPGYGFWAMRRLNGISMPMLTRRGLDDLATQSGLAIEDVARAGYNWVARLSPPSPTSSG